MAVPNPDVLPEGLQSLFRGVELARSVLRRQELLDALMKRALDAIEECITQRADVISARTSSIEEPMWFDTPEDGTAWSVVAEPLSTSGVPAMLVVAGQAHAALPFHAKARVVSLPGRGECRSAVLVRSNRHICQASCSLFDYLGDNARQVNAPEFEARLKREPAVLEQDEKVLLAFRVNRDCTLFTSKRILIIDVQGFSGKRVAFRMRMRACLGLRHASYLEFPTDALSHTFGLGLAHRRPTLLAYGFVPILADQSSCASAADRPSALSSPSPQGLPRSPVIA